MADASALCLLIRNRVLVTSLTVACGSLRAWLLPCMKCLHPFS